LNANVNAAFPALADTEEVAEIAPADADADADEE
jgi:hypothetical protein